MTRLRSTSNDGLVPYRSFRLEGAASEKVVHADHSVQESPQAVIEQKRIVHLDIRERASDGMAALQMAEEI